MSKSIQIILRDYFHHRQIHEAEMSSPGADLRGCRRGLNVFVIRKQLGELKSLFSSKTGTRVLVSGPMPPKRTFSEAYIKGALTLAVFIIRDICGVEKSKWSSLLQPVLKGMIVLSVQAVYSTYG